MSAYAPQPGKGPWVGAGVGAIIVDGGRVLLLKRKKEPEAGCWGIQGGALEFGETTKEAARRELREKLGVECEVVRLLGSRTTSSPERAYTGSRRCSWRES